MSILQKDFLKKAVQFSIRTKILFLGTGIVLASFAAYVPYVKNSFIKDKGSYIQDDSLNEAHDVQISVTHLIESREKDLVQFFSFGSRCISSNDVKL